jgi:hypothetical protein
VQTHLFDEAVAVGVLGISKETYQYLTSPCKPAIRVASKTPAQTPSKLPQPSPSTPATKRHHKQFKVGDRVQILDSGLHHKKDGKVIAVFFGSTDDNYRIALDKESHLSREVTITVPHSQKFPLMNL